MNSKLNNNSKCFLFYKINYVTGVLVTNWAKSLDIFMSQLVLSENRDTNKEYIFVSTHKIF